MIKIFKWQFAFSSGASQFVVKVSIFVSFFSITKKYVYHLHISTDNIDYRKIQSNNIKKKD